MATKKDDTSKVDDVEEVDEVEVEEEGDGDDEEAGWNRLGEIVRGTVKEELESWAGQQKKTTSSRSPRKVAPPKPKRKQGFLSGQFFSNLNPTDAQE